MDQPAPQRAPDPGFVADCRSAVAQWRRAPALPVASVAYQVLWASVGGNPFLDLAFATLTVGWPGVQRAWYQRLFEGERLELAEVPHLLRAYFRRFLVLAFLVLAVMMVPILILGVLAVSGVWDFAVFVTGIVAVSLVGDFLLTFVTPALALTTASAREAISLGFGMLRESWPACALYVFVPPLAIETAFQLLRVSGSSRLIQSGFTALIALMCKGATVRFYVRRRAATDPTWRTIDARDPAT